MGTCALGMNDHRLTSLLRQYTRTADGDGNITVIALPVPAIPAKQRVESARPLLRLNRLHVIGQIRDAQDHTGVIADRPEQSTPYRHISGSVNSDFIIALNEASHTVIRELAAIARA